MTPSARRLLLFMLCLTLFALFVWHGTLVPDPAENQFPGNNELTQGTSRPIIKS
jgi:hypothetical protein